MRTNHVPWSGSTEAAMSGRPDAEDIAAAARMWGPARSRLVTWRDPSVVASGTRRQSGLDALRAIREGALPPWPMQRLLQMDLVTLEQGRVEVRCAVDESVYSPLGAVHGGLVCTLLDTVAGCAVLSTLPPGAGFTSIELKVSFLRPVVLVSGPLTAVGTVVKAGRRIAFAEGEVVDAAGRDVATGSSSLLIFPVSPEDDPPDAGGTTTETGHDQRSAVAAQRIDRPTGRGSGSSGPDDRPGWKADKS
jgi:uncharacterized protein (TIGR00369 family)